MIFTYTASAQRNFKPGYIVKNSRDTIRGYIDDGSAASNSFVCNFKPTEDASINAFAPNEIKAYGIANNKHYISKSIQITDGSFNAFLMVLVTGKVDLYYINNNGLEGYYIGKEDDLYALTNEEITFIDKGVTYKKNTNRHRRILASIMKDVPAVLPIIEKIDLKRKPLIDLVEEYHKQSSPPQEWITYHETKLVAAKEKIRLKYGIAIGGNFSKMRFNSEMGNARSYMFSDATIPGGSISFKAEMMYTNLPMEPFFPREKGSTINLFPALFINITRGGKNSFQIETAFFKNKYAIREFTIETYRLMIPLMYRRGLGYYKKTELFINAGLFAAVNLASQTDNFFLRYRIPVKKDNDYKYVTMEEKLSKQNTTGSSLNGGFIMGVGLTYDLSPTIGLVFDLRTSISKQTFESNFDDHIFVYSKMRYWNNSLSLGLSF